MMKKLLGPIVVSAATVLLIIACRGDVILEPPPSLVGSYVGTYTWQEGQGSGASAKVQAITFVFRETNFSMEADTSAAEYDPGVCFCKAFGPYAITDRVRLELQDSAPHPDNCVTCDPGESPQGLYALEQPPNKVILTWIQTMDVGGSSQIVTSKLDLTRVPD